MKIRTSDIGNFSTIEQMKTYQVAQTTRQNVEIAARDLMNVDEDKVDLNIDVRGSVAVDAFVCKKSCSKADSTYTGTLQYDPGTQKIKKMDVKVDREGFSHHYEVERRKEWFGMGDEVLVVRDGLAEVKYNMMTGTISYETLSFGGF